MKGKREQHRNENQLWSVSRANASPTPCRAASSERDEVQVERVINWPLQDIVLLRDFCARINHLFNAPPHLDCPHHCNTGCGVCDTPELWCGAAGLCARVRACAGAAESLHTYTYIHAMLLHDDCAIYDPPPTLLLHTIHHIKWVWEISCKGQVIMASDVWRTFSWRSLCCCCVSFAVFNLVYERLILLPKAALTTSLLAQLEVVRVRLFGPRVNPSTHTNS